MGNLGVSVKMVAGDNIAIAKEVGKFLGLEREFIHTHESAIVEMIEQVNIFAEVVPEDKYRIVDTLQKGKHIVAGHSTIYVARTGERHFWEKPYPSLKLFVPAFTTRIIGTLIACYGLFMEPVGWEYTAYIWIYGRAWFVLNDFVKVGVYKMLRSKGWLEAGEHSAAVSV